MEKNNRTEGDILGMKNSRFSGEERARMAEENVRVRNSSEKKNSRSTAKERKSDRGASASRDIKNTADKGRSRNDRVRSSSEQRKKDKKKQSNIVIAMLFVIALTLMGVLAAVVLKINTVEIKGTEMYSEKSVLTAAGIDVGDSMLLYNAAAVEARIETKLPYIEKAEIKRSWPDKVMIQLTDAVASLAVDTGDGYILMNNSCKILDDDATSLGADTALIKGVRIIEPVPGTTVKFNGDISTEDFVRLTTAFRESGIENISRYDLSSISSVVVEIDHRIEVRLGTLAGAYEKFAFGKKVIEDTIASDTKHAMLIDITADGTAYVRQKNDNNAVFGDENTTAPETTTGEVGESSINSVG